ncbi:hypothetical protein [Corynebacterium gerontici]|nr:hypothetical protein [Corynebacterium gerontici]
MNKWMPTALLLLLAQLVAVFALDGSASYTMCVGAVLMLTALTFAWAPQQARRVLLVGNDSVRGLRRRLIGCHACEGVRLGGAVCNHRLVNRRRPLGILDDV